MLLKVLAKVIVIFLLSSLRSERAITIAIAIVGRAIKKEAKNLYQMDAKRIKSDNFTWSNREKLYELVLKCSE